MTDKNEPLKDTLFTFPCEFPLKVMGKNDPEFLTSVKRVVQRHVPDVTDQAYAHKISKHGRFTSVTVTFTATSKEQLDSIYMELTDSDLALYVL